MCVCCGSVPDSESVSGPVDAFRIRCSGRQWTPVARCGAVECDPGDERSRSAAIFVSQSSGRSRANSSVCVIWCTGHHSSGGSKFTVQAPRSSPPRLARIAKPNSLCNARQRAASSVRTGSPSSRSVRRRWWTPSLLGNRCRAIRTEPEIALCK